MNYTAIILAALANTLIGVVWYALFLPGQTSAASTAQRYWPLWVACIRQFPCALLMSYILALFIEFFYVDTFRHVILLSILIWTGFIFPSALSWNIFQRDTLKHFTLNIAYQLIAIVVMAVILVL